MDEITVWMAPPNLESSSDNPKAYTILPMSDNDEKLFEPHEDLPSIPDHPHEEEHSLVHEKPPPNDSDVCSDDIEVVVPPDGGWGWVVVFASFMCNVIVDGIIFSYGMFLDDITVEFRVTKGKAALVGSMMSGFYLIVGPFASAIANKFGFRLVAVLGSVLGACAFAISSFASSVEFLCISYGLLGGIGFGFIYVPSVITVGFYFEKWRPLATGIAVCGSGIGTFLFAPLSKSLIKQLGWRNALLVQGGIVLSCVIYGCLFRPLKPTRLKDLRDAEEEEMKANEDKLVMDISKLPEGTRLKMEEALMQFPKQNHRSSISMLFETNNNPDNLRLSDVYHTIHHMPSKTYTAHIPAKSCFKEKRLSAPFVVPYDKLKLQDNKCSEKSQDIAKNHVEGISRPLYRDDIFFGQSLSRLPQYTSHSSMAYNLAVTRLPPKEDIIEQKTQKCKIYPEAVKRALNTMLDFSLLRSPSFLMLAIGGFFTMMGFYVPFMYMPDRAHGHIPDDIAVLLISSVGIANTLGRVLCGVLSSFPSVNGLVVANVALTIGGIATIFSGVSLTQEYQFFYTVIFGLAISCFASLRSIIVVDLLGLEKLTNAFGLLLLFQGAAAMIGSPLAGAFRDLTGSHDATFYLSGGMILISAVMCYPLNWVNRWENRRNRRKGLERV
ncbi:monocarboxylate transporter 12-like isoform X1 [Euwallacea fornicatus]|uniref:monocarboxylate transporter 12-like isoform X1 n=2 Tax=Euwallacea fornicatus TaxID=995702 RepID=UPI003390218A